MPTSTWALSQISQLLPLDEESLQQILDYAATLSNDAAAEHLKTLLGDSPKALDFISSWNSRRKSSLPSQVDPVPSASGPPGRSRGKRKAPIKKLPPPRQPENHGDTSGAYSKKEEEDYMSGSRRPRQSAPVSSAFALSETPAARQLPTPVSTTHSKPPPSASGPLISDLPNVRTSSRTASPAAKAKVNVSGGSPMHGASTTLQDLDSAIRTLELQTNPSLSGPPSARRCSCLATRHPLLAAAPNCLNCGKIICVKEGIGPCTFCSAPLLSPVEISSMIRSLREERGVEKMMLHNASQRRADLAQTPRPFSTPSNLDPLPSSSTAEATLTNALQHRDKLLSYQRDNARRTHIIDEAADFETPSAGQSMWSTPAQRAAQLKRQQKALREQEWNARPEYEKRRVVVSLDLVGGKAVRRMGEVERPREKDEAVTDEQTTQGGKGRDGALSRNPLLGALIRPVWKRTPPDGPTHDDETKHEVTEDNKENAPTRTRAWRRVQDEQEDNEAWILDGGAHVRGGDEERACG
ncbi:hypothetical protein MMC07_008334 [Pseudocyphellaria aurata]|nr:hypothetical protein [Pseudocyphellaria aurata]